MNALGCYAAYLLRSPASAKGSMLVSLELDNYCLFCRNAKGELFDANPRGQGVSQGTMPLALAKDTILPTIPLAL